MAEHSYCPQHSDDWLVRAVANNRRLRDLPPQDCICEPAPPPERPHTDG